MRLKFSNLFKTAMIALGVAALLLANDSAFAAACCGGGNGIPGIIIGDEKANLTVELSSLQIQTDVSQNSIWRDRKDPDATSSFRIQYTQVFSDRFQWGISTSVLKRDRADQSSTGLADTSLHLGYEVLPDWSYSNWRPRAVSYIGLTAPTGRSIYEAEDALLLDARGKGFWSVRAGTAFSKVLRRLSFLSNIEFARTFSKKLDTASYQGLIEPQNSMSVVVGAGYAFSKFTIQASLLHLYEERLVFSGGPDQNTSDSQVSTFSIGASSPIGTENSDGDLWILNAEYFDQRIMGQPKNTALTNGFTVSLRRVFSR